MYIYTYTYIHIHIYIYIYTCVYIYIYIHNYVCVYIDIYIYIYTHTCPYLCSSESLPRQGAWGMRNSTPVLRAAGAECTIGCLFIRLCCCYLLYCLLLCCCVVVLCCVYHFWRWLVLLLCFYLLYVLFACVLSVFCFVGWFFLGLDWPYHLECNAVHTRTTSALRTRRAKYCRMMTQDLSSCVRTHMRTHVMIDELILTTYTFVRAAMNDHWRCDR